MHFSPFVWLFISLSFQKRKAQSLLIRPSPLDVEGLPANTSSPSAPSDLPVHVQSCYNASSPANLAFIENIAQGVSLLNARYPQGALLAVVAQATPAPSEDPAVFTKLAIYYNLPHTDSVVVMRSSDRWGFWEQPELVTLPEPPSNKAYQWDEIHGLDIDEAFRILNTYGFYRPWRAISVLKPPSLLADSQLYYTFQSPPYPSGSTAPVVLLGVDRKNIIFGPGVGVLDA